MYYVERMYVLAYWGSFSRPGHWGLGLKEKPNAMGTLDGIESRV